MTKKYVVGYDGSASSRRALDFAVADAKSDGASIAIAYVLEWSPYSFLTPDELEERHKRRGEEVERAKTAIIDPVLESLSKHGLEITSVIRYGHVAETLCDIVKQEGAAQIYIGRTGESGIMSRFFGSVAGSLAQMSPVPCTLIP